MLLVQQTEKKIAFRPLTLHDEQDPLACSIGSQAIY